MCLHKFIFSPLLLFFPVIALADSTTVILSFLAPGPSPQDLAWDGNYLWCVDDSTDSLYKLNPSDGAIISSFPTPGPEPRGLTWDGSYLWCSDNDSVKIFKLDPSDGSAIFSIPAPFEDFPDVRGLAWDGQYLWSGYFAGYSSKIVRVDTTDGSQLTWFYFRGGDAYGVACDGTRIWYTSNRAGRDLGLIYQHRILANGSVIYETNFELPVYYPTGLAFDGKYLWLADEEVNRIYKLELIHTSVELSKIEVPGSLKLYQNYPNPFNAGTMIHFELPFNGMISLKIFNTKGQLIRTLIHDEQPAGYHSIFWDGRDDFGQNVASGVYFYQLLLRGCSFVKKMSLIR